MVIRVNNLLSVFINNLDGGTDCSCKTWKRKMDWVLGTWSCWGTKQFCAMYSGYYSRSDKELKSSYTKPKPVLGNSNKSIRCEAQEVIILLYLVLCLLRDLICTVPNCECYMVINTSWERLFQRRAMRLLKNEVVLLLKRMLKMQDFPCGNNCWIILNNFFLDE